MKKLSLILLITILAVLPAFAQSIPELQEKPSDLSLFLGRFHPLIVHLPIGFILLAFLMEALSRIPKFRHLGGSVSFVLLLGILSAVGAAVFGYLLSLSGEYQGATLDWHLWLGIGTIVLASIALLLKTKGIPNAYLPVLFGAVVCLSFTGHLGGNLTHGSDYLVKYMPNPMRKVVGLPPKANDEDHVIANLEEAIIFDDVIKPITDAKCESCHNPEKTKGDLRLDTKEGFQKGGENGPVFTAGKPANSELIKRIKLPQDHDDVMPPEGKKPLSKDEILLMEWWIENEASFDKKVAETTPTPEVQEILDALVNPKSKTINPVFAQDIPPASEEDLKELRKHGFSAAPISSEIPLLQVSYLNTSAPLSKEQLKTLVNHSKQIIWLNLSKTKLDDGLDFGFLEDFEHLAELHLDHTAIQDEDLNAIQKMQWLEYLNLYGSGISDAGIKKLHRLQHLKSIYLWKTATTEKGRTQLQEKLPELDINAAPPSLVLFSRDSLKNEFNSD
ncbi:ribonuclease inhibitor [Echinicola soli]|uniref:Ribonuclease inhibitor n=1 Tax=Echinicola soli TaxID=2591634 RepID=A0A514CDL1_9BACT|nr:c-type cytochrome domain-containing protein [Echinicola soli]QDH77903.1 ribonuclease inhibitor [Echinicola soli]